MHNLIQRGSVFLWQCIHVVFSTNTYQNYCYILGDDLFHNSVWLPYNTRNCGSDLCDYPREFCFRNTLNLFGDDDEIETKCQTSTKLITNNFNSNMNDTHGNFLLHCSLLQLGIMNDK